MEKSVCTNDKEKQREKKLKYLIYLKSELLKETKKELMGYRRGLNNLGNPKGKVKGKKR